MRDYDGSSHQDTHPCTDGERSVNGMNGPWFFDGAQYQDDAAVVSREPLIDYLRRTHGNWN